MGSHFSASLLATVIANSMQSFVLVVVVFVGLFFFPVVNIRKTNIIFVRVLEENGGIFSLEIVIVLPKTQLRATFWGMHCKCY